MEVPLLRGERALKEGDLLQLDDTTTTSPALPLSDPDSSDTDAGADNGDNDSSNDDNSAENGDNIANPLAQLYPGLSALEHTTRPTSRFTEASFIAELESIGVGRPSTYSKVLQILKERGYILVDQRTIVPTIKGIVVSNPNPNPNHNPNPNLNLRSTYNLQRTC